MASSRQGAEDVSYTYLSTVKCLVLRLRVSCHAILTQLRQREPCIQDRWSHAILSRRSCEPVKRSGWIRDVGGYRVDGALWTGCLPIARCGLTELCMASTPCLLLSKSCWSCPCSSIDEVAKVGWRLREFEAVFQALTAETQVSYPLPMQKRCRGSCKAFGEAH